MSKPNPLAGLIANYGDSDDDSDDGMVYTSYTASDKETNKVTVLPGQEMTPSNVAGIHPAPIAHCPWSACYDESSGFTYYWNQKTNAVTWEAPPEYLLALKIAQQHLHTSGSAEVSAEEWQLYQQALAEKQNSQNKLLAKAAIAKSSAKHDKPNVSIKEKKTKGSKKRPVSDDEDEKIELITSYHNSDSESNDESESPAKAPQKPPAVPKAPKIQKICTKKPKKVQVYGPAMPPNTNYSVPIGPELPPNIKNATVTKPEEKPKSVTVKEIKKPTVSDNCDEIQDEGTLLKRLKDQAKVLEKLGGELPTEIKQIIKEDTSNTVSTKSEGTKSLDIDDLLQEIEKKEFGKGKKAESDSKSNLSSGISSPKSDGNRTPPLEELKALFPSAKIIESVTITSNIDIKPPSPQKLDKKENIYLTDTTEPVENTNRKRLRISNSVLPERKTNTPVYTTRYANEGFGLGFSGKDDFRTGLGFSIDEEDSPKDTVNYGNGLTFTKGGTLNGENETVKVEKNDMGIDDEPQVLESRLAQLCEMQPAVVPELQKMLIQLQTLLAAQSEGALSPQYLITWSKKMSALLPSLEATATAPPPGWTCSFHRCVGRYRYRRECDGLLQNERPALDNTDMDISTTPPHPGHESKEASPPLAPPPAPSPSPPPAPSWPEPPPPGCDDPPPLPPEAPVKEIGDELTSFYNDIAELEKGTTAEPQETLRDKDAKSSKKKSKVKISSSMGLKHKSVSNLVAKWQQVAEEINSD